MSFLSNRNICKIAIVIISRLRDWNVYLWLFPGSTTVFISLICRQRARPDFSFQRSFFDTFFTSYASSTSSLKDKDKGKEHSFSTVNHFWLRSLFKGIGYDGGGRGGRGRGWAAVASSTFVLFLLFKHIWFDGQSRTLWSVHNDCQIVFRNSKAQKFDTLGLLRKSLSLVSGSWKVLQLLLKYFVPPDTRQLVLSSLF